MSTSLVLRNMERAIVDDLRTKLKNTLMVHAEITVDKYIDDLASKLKAEAHVMSDVETMGMITKIVVKDARGGWHDCTLA